MRTCERNSLRQLQQGGETYVCVTTPARECTAKLTKRSGILSVQIREFYRIRTSFGSLARHGACDLGPAIPGPVSCTWNPCMHRSESAPKLCETGFLKAKRHLYHRRLQTPSHRSTSSLFGSHLQLESRIPPHMVCGHAFAYFYFPVAHCPAKWNSFTDLSLLRVAFCCRSVAVRSLLRDLTRFTHDFGGDGVLFRRHRAPV